MSQLVKFSLRFRQIRRGLLRAMLRVITALVRMFAIIVKSWAFYFEYIYYDFNNIYPGNWQSGLNSLVTWFTYTR